MNKYNKIIESLKDQTKKDNWDDENGLAILDSQWAIVKNVLVYTSVINTSIYSPIDLFISACGDGYIHLTWAKINGDKAILEIGVDNYWFTELPINLNVNSVKTFNFKDYYSIVSLLRDFVNE